MDSSKQQASSSNLGDDGEHEPMAHEIDASFRKTYESIEALFTSKRGKLSTLKQLVIAEAKLSLSSVLVVIGLGLLLLVAGTTVWLLINFGLGWLIFYYLQSGAISVITLILVNTLLCVYLFKQIQKVYELVGFPTATATLSEASEV